VVAAIRAEDSDRLIICDGFKFAPAPELIELGVAQAGRGYAPSQITHYRASWVNGSDRWPVPTWPRVEAHGWLLAPGKREHAGHPLVVRGPFPDACTLRMRVGDVSREAVLVVQADGQEAFRRGFSTGPEGKGPWKSSRYQPQWKIYNCTYDADFDVAIPAGARELRVFVEKGDWMQITRLTVVVPGADNACLALDARYGTPASELQWNAGTHDWRAPEMQDRRWLREHYLKPWLSLREQGVGIMIGEMGVFKHTPHDVALAFIEDCLKNYKEAGIGWALWNFDGSFGIIDSGREDVEYEDWRGHKLDRKMLDLLQRY